MGARYSHWSTVNSSDAFENGCIALQCCARVHGDFNPLMPTLKLHSNGLLHSSTVIGTLAVDGWAVTFGTALSARSGLGGLGPRQVSSLLYQM